MTEMFAIFSYIFSFLFSLIFLSSTAENVSRERQCSMEGSYTCGENFCCCYKRQKTDEVVANCSGHGAELQYIPNIKGNLKILYFAGNLLSDLSTETLSNLTNPKCVRQISIAASGVSNISKDAFAFEEFRCLLLIDLSGNKNMNLSQLQIGLGSAKKMRSLYLNDIGLSSLPDDFFSHIQNKGLKKIYLRYNLLKTLNLKPFLRVKTLNNLDVGENVIEEVSLTVEVKHIRNLRLSGNRLGKLPKFCPPGMKKVSLPNLVVLDLTFNSIENIPEYSFHCLHDLIALYLYGNKLLELTKNAFSTLPNLKKLGIGNMKRQLNKIQPFAFNCPRLIKLQLNRNDLDIETGTANDSFAGLPSLEKLDLSNNNLGGSGKRSTVLADRLSPLRSIILLKIRAAKISWIPPGLLKNNENMSYIDATDNPIEDLHDSFKYARSLKNLTLSKTRITVIREEDFPPNVLTTLESLNMSLNPYTCTCDTIWFRNWLVKMALDGKVQSWPMMYKCSTPVFIRNVTLLEFHPSVDSCRDSIGIMLAFLIIGLILIVIALGVLTLCFFMWNRMFPKFTGNINDTSDRTPLLQGDP